MLKTHALYPRSKLRGIRLKIKSPDGFPAASSSEPLEEMLNGLENRTGWQDLDAVKNGHLYIINGGTKSVHNSIFCLFLAKALHPDIFMDIDPESIYHRWYSQFMENDNQLLVVYPPSKNWK